MIRALTMLSAAAALIVYAVLIVEPSPVLGVVGTALLLVALAFLSMSRKDAS